MTVVIAHYNDAAAMARAIAAHDEPCAPDTKYSTQEIAAALRLSMRLEPRRRERVEQDADFDYFRRTVWFQELLGAEPHTQAGLTALLPKVTWRGHPIWSDTTRPTYARFHAGGAADDVEDLHDDSGEKDWRKRPASWRVIQGSADGGRASLLIELKVAAANGRPALQFRGPLLPDGRILFGERWWLSDAPGEDCCC